MKRTVSGIILLIVLLGVLTLAFDIPLAKAAGTIYIRADGSIDPPTANITTSDYVTYTFTDNNYASIMVQRSNIVIDGNGYTLQGSGSGYGIDVVGKSNVEIKNMIIEAFNYGIYLFSFSDFNTVSGNNITANNQYGIYLYSSSNNTISGNHITTNSESGIYLYSSSNNTISGNNVTANNQFGIYLFSSSNNNAISGNNVTANYYDGICLSVSSNYNVISGNGITANNYFGIGLYSSLGNSISENSITDNGYGFDGYGIALDTSSDNLIYHNNFVNNNKQVKGSNTPNVWDDGYPFGGNCWSDYRTRYPSAVEVDDSLIWNTPYVIDVSNQDNYPLMGPWTSNGENVTVNPASGVYLAFANVTSGGITIVNETQSGPTPLVGYKLEGRYYDVETTASYSSNVTVRTTYEDTSMTQQEEESLLITRWNETMEQWVNITTHVDMVNNVIYGETSHLSIFGVHSLLIHDLSIFGVHASKNTIGQGYPLEILVDVRNEGDFAEDFDVTVDLDSGQISYLSIFGVHLVNAETVTVAFNWNTAESGEGTYLLTAHVSQVAYEIDTSDNTYPDGQVKVTISGDINGDWIVNIADATQIGLWWQKAVPPAPANVDINGNGIINIGDATIIGLNWQKHV